MNWSDPSCLGLWRGRGQRCVAFCATDQVRGCVSACQLPGLFASWIRSCFWTRARPHRAGGGGGGAGTSLLAHWWARLGWLHTCNSHSDTLTLFIAALRSNREQSPRRRLKPRVVLEEKLISSILRRTCSEWSSPPQRLSLTVPSHFSSKPACQIGWSVPVFVLKWSLEVLIQRQILLLCVFKKCCEYAHFNDDPTFFFYFFFFIMVFWSAWLQSSESAEHLIM